MAAVQDVEDPFDGVVTYSASASTAAEAEAAAVVAAVVEQHWERFGQGQKAIPFDLFRRLRKKEDVGD